MSTSPAAVKMPGPPNHSGWVAFVTLATAELDEVRVRFQADRPGDKWVCEACGRQTVPTCLHCAYAAAHVNRAHARASIR